jgi:hypothetical protein
MFGTIRKHSTWLWLIIITLTIISFVFWGANTARLQSGPTSFGRLSGEPISRADFFNARNEVILRNFLERGQRPDRNSDVEQETYVWLFHVQKLNDLGIHVPKETIAKVANNYVRHVNQGNLMPLADFSKKYLEPNGLTADDFDRYLQHILGQEQLKLMVGVSGNLTPMEEIRAIYAREYEEYSTQAAFFSASNYLEQVTVTPEAVMQYYTNHMAEYRIPDRVTVSYIKFPISNYLAEVTKLVAGVTNLDQILEANFQRQGGTNAFKDKTPEQAKEEIREKMFKNDMRRLAANKANEVASHVFDMKPVRPDNLATFAKTNGLTVEVTPPFDRKEPPKDLKVDDVFVRTAFALTSDEPFAGPILGEDAVYVIASNQRLPSENPPFESVREKATWDYKFSEAAGLARKAGGAFNQAVTNGLAAGKGFVEICSEAKVKPVLPPPFSLVSTSLPPVEAFLNLEQYKRLVLMTGVGKASPFIPLREGGVLVYVAAKLPLDETRMRADMPKFAQAVRQARQREAYNMWLNQEAGRALRETPIMRQQQPQVSGAPGQ